MRALFVLLLSLSLTGPLLADTYSYYYFSLEWLVDASDSIVEATVVPSPYTGNPSGSTIHVKSITRVLKQVGNDGPVEGANLPCHLAGGTEHRVLLMTRPAPDQSGKRICYCVYLTAETKPEVRKVDPFGFLPFHTSTFGPVPFRHPRCVAIDQETRVLTNPDAVLRLVEARIKANPKHVSAEGRNIKCGPKVDDGDDHNLRVPAVPKGK